MNGFTTFIKETSAKKLGLLGCFSIFIIFGIVGAFSPKNDTNSTETSVKGEDTKIAITSSTLTSNSSPKTTETSNATSLTTQAPPPVTKQWVKVAELKTSSNNESQNFSLVGGQQKLVYKASGDFVFCSLYVMKSDKSFEKDGGIPEVTITETKEGESIIRKVSGEYYLKTITNQQCDMELYEYK